MYIFINLAIDLKCLQENVERRDIKEEKQRKRNKYPSYS